MTQSRNAVSGLRPLTARSVVLSTLLGMDPPELDGAALVATGGLFGLAPGTVRVALSRMVSAGELANRDGVYELAGRMRDRQARQATALRAGAERWDGGWRMGIAGPGLSAFGRAERRRRLLAARFAEHREGLWLRPAYALDDVDVEGVDWFTSTPDADERELAARLWDLAEWASTAEHLAEAMAATRPALAAREASELAPTFAIAAAVTRHLTVDPRLPPALLPPAWPGPALRRAYRSYQRDFSATWRAWHRRWRPPQRQ